MLTKRFQQAQNGSWLRAEIGLMSRRKELRDYRLRAENHLLDSARSSEMARDELIMEWWKNKERMDTS